MEELYPQNDLPMLKVSQDAISWEIFDTTKEIKGCEEKDGLTNCIIKPEYSPQIKALNNKKITLMGYMFPLEQNEKQKNFLFGPYPLSCPFHYHTRPALVVEIIAQKPITFSYDPIKIEGTLEVRFDMETQTFYYLTNAVLK